MDKPEHQIEAPAGWLVALAECDAQLAAGQIVPGEELMRELLESIDLPEAEHPYKSPQRTAPRR